MTVYLTRRKDKNYYLLSRKPPILARILNEEFEDVFAEPGDPFYFPYLCKLQVAAVWGKEVLALKPLESMQVHLLGHPVEGTEPEFVARRVELVKVCEKNEI